MDVPEGEVAFGNRLHDDADGEDVKDVVELAVAAEHLVVDAVYVLGASLDGAVEVFERHLDLQRPDDGLHVLLAPFFVLDKGVDDFLVFVRIDVLETQVFEFGLQFVQTEPVGEGHVDVERFLCDGTAFFGLHVAHRPHVVDAVGDFDHDDPRVLCHRGDELAVSLRLLRGLVLFLGRGNLGDCVHHERSVFAEFLRDFCERVLRILDHVVQ